MAINRHHTKLKGDIATSAVIFDLTKSGHFVFIPAVTEHAPYDVIVDTGIRLWRIQVKMSTTGLVPCASTWVDKNTNHLSKIDPTSFDCFAIVNSDADKIAYCPSSFMNRTICFDRNTISDFQRKIYWWEDFRNLSTVAAAHQVPSKTDQQARPKRRHPNPTPPKIVWPSDLELELMLKSNPATKVAKELGVSDVAIHRRCKIHNIPKPTRGHWSK